MTGFCLDKMDKMVRYKIRLFYNAIRAIVKIQEKYKNKEIIIV